VPLRTTKQFAYITTTSFAYNGINEVSGMLLNISDQNQTFNSY